MGEGKEHWEEKGLGEFQGKHGGLPWTRFRTVPLGGGYKGINIWVRECGYEWLHGYNGGSMLDEDLVSSGVCELSCCWGDAVYIRHGGMEEKNLGPYDEEETGKQ